PPGQDLKASLTFSTACLIFELLWSALPSASSCSSSVARPTPSLTLPPNSSALLSTLSSNAMTASTSSCQRLWSTPTCPSAIIFPATPRWPGVGLRVAQAGVAGGQGAADDPPAHSQTGGDQGPG